ncbi:DUF6615 family protein [Brachybacterium atlanticum]|uniref:DUF6615 family protein n=1 Tax=Brachybacterium atlanticum TaxID=2911888 RepID=UPI0021E0E218|nr:DUF6615 family protein [Brachybacterium atlanticum]
MTALAFFQAMQQAMDDQAADVWNMVEYSRDSGYRLRLGEVTVTELNFYRLRHFWTKGVYLRTNEPDEYSTGADWEWLIGHENEWLQIRVQAKIVNKAGAFSELGHGPIGAKGQQMDRLIDPPDDDVVCRWMPLYVFYTATPPSGRAGQGAGPIDARTGCSVKPARWVRNVYGPHRGRATLAARVHLADSVPWSDVFTGLVTRLQAGQTLSAIVNSLSNQVLPDNIRTVHDFWDPTVSNGHCVGSLPDYVRAIIERRGDHFDDAPLAELQVEVPRLITEDSSPVRAGERIGERGTPGRWPKNIGNGDAAEIPSRKLLLDRPPGKTKVASLPNFVSVIDIDDLPAVRTGAPEGSPEAE